MLSIDKSSPRKIWIYLLSNVIWIIEKVLFYPKLTRAYKELNLSQPQQRSLLIFDVGANKGQSIKFFLNLYPDSAIYAFEPSAKIFKTLEMLKKKLLSQEVSIFQIGMGNFQGTMNFYESILDETSTFVLPNQSSIYLKRKNRILFQKPRNAFIHTIAKMITFDEFCRDKKTGYVDILKIDVEGFEFEVLSGANQALKRGDINIIQIEGHKDDMREDNLSQIHKLLIAHKYVKVKEIKHPFGNFVEILYQNARTKA